MCLAGKPDDIYQMIVDLVDLGRDGVLATVLESTGSTPCKPGHRAVFDADRLIHGTIGGGHVEAEAMRHAGEVLKQRRTMVLDFSLDSPDVEGNHPICGGVVRVLLEPIVAQHYRAFTQAASIQQRRQRGVLLTRLYRDVAWEVEVECLGQQSLHAGMGSLCAESIDAALLRGEARLVTWDADFDPKRGELFIQPLVPRPLAVIVGGGHVGQAVATQAHLVGFDIVVIDDRREFTCPELFPPGTLLRCSPIEHAFLDLPLDSDTYIVIVTRGHQHDAGALTRCIHKPLGYLGMIGSQRKVAMMRKDFVEEGRATAAEFDRVFAPIGLDIGANTVPEIATSIVAQMISVRRKGNSSKIPAR